MVMPLQDKLEDWRRTVGQLDKDHSKEYKKLRAEIKKKGETCSRAQKKASSKKSSAKGHEGHQRNSAADAALADVTKHYRLLVDTEKSAVRRALVEERSRYCAFVACLKPLLDEEVAMVAEFQQLEEVSKKLAGNTEEPFKLPQASEQVLNDLALASSDFAFQTPPSSPSSLGSRKSSMCSISSAGSSSNGGSSMALQHHSPSHSAASAAATLRHRSLSQVRSCPF
jgi:hypothetical protein